MSLIESCVSAAIVVSLAAIAVPSVLRSLDDYLLQSAAHDVASKVQSARIQAISRNVDCRIRVTSNASYTIDCRDPMWTVMDSVTLPPGMTISATTRPEFHRLGNVVPSATLTVTNRKGRQKRIVVNNEGRIRID